MGRNVDVFLEQAKKVKEEMGKLHRCWEKLSSDENVIAESDYPFAHSYDEIVSSVGTWVDSIEERSKQEWCPECRDYVDLIEVRTIPFDVSTSNQLCKSCLGKLKAQLRDKTLKDIEELESIINGKDIRKIRQVILKAEEVVSGEGEQIYGPIHHNTLQSYVRLDKEGYKLQNYYDINALDHLFMQNVSKEDIKEFVK
jgi:molybdopterin converting factor small subunit